MKEAEPRMGNCLFRAENQIRGGAHSVPRPCLLFCWEMRPTVGFIFPAIT